MKTAFGESPRVAGGLIATLSLAVLALVLAFTSAPAGAAPLPGGSLDPTTIPKYQEPLVIPPAMPRTRRDRRPRESRSTTTRSPSSSSSSTSCPRRGRKANGIDPTTVWSYASLLDPRPVAEGGTLNYPALTIEAQKDRPVRVKWVNGLVDESGAYLPHLFAVDQTLHWANPAGRPRWDRHARHGRPAVHRARCRS